MSKLTTGLCAGCLAVCLMGLAGAGEEAAPGLRVAYFPEAAYADEPTTFVVECVAGEPVSAALGTEKLAEQTSQTNRMEMTLSLDRGGILRFQQGARHREFHVIQPGDGFTLVEKEGFLYTEKGPAILLAAHRHPPKHDRRWETVSFLRRMFKDDRPEIAKALLIHAAGLALPDPARRLPDGKPWRSTALPDASREIHALLVAPDLSEKANLILLAFSDRDLEQGADAFSLRVKLEWFMQRVGDARGVRIVVVYPTLTASQKERFSEYLGGLPLGLAGNGGHHLRLESRAEGARLEPGAWAGPALSALDGMFVFKGEVEAAAGAESGRGK